MNAALTVDVTHRFSPSFELQVQFSVAAGVFAIFGPSGSGKSTLLRIIAGALTPARGRISMFARTVLDTTRRVDLPPERRCIGLMTQDALLFPHMSVRQNMQYGARRRPARRVDFHRVVEVLELRNLLDRLPNGLSGGEAQRVALARALLRGPELLLLDEPFTGLEAPLKQRVIDYLERVLHEWRVPTLYVSHDQLDVRRLANSVLILNGGRVVACGPAAPTLDRAALAGQTPDDGPVNLLRIDQVVRDGDAWSGTINGQRCSVAPPPGPPGEEAAGARSEPDAHTVWVRFAPNAVTLSRVVPAGLSIRNCLRALVRETVQARGRVFVLLDIGQPMWAEVTPAAATELGVAPGLEIWALMKSSALVPISASRAAESVR